MGLFPLRTEQQVRFAVARAEQQIDQGVAFLAPPENPPEHTRAVAELARQILDTFGSNPS